ncbi:MAG: hypothetical protein IKZ56_13370 [Bacteroidales bacterium]|nr:hypothetical protein [Bacteroidales bacterium]MBR5922142.1 hypothetical protein [Bacteroidales bacterium]
MKKSILLFSTLLLLCLASTAQTTYYYKLTKKKVNGVVSENVSGGQFITINKNVCYESDKEGFTVNHGRMDYKSTDENGIRLYVGGSYYGSNSILLFKSDYSSFNIKTDKGDVYVYKRATPPSGVTTCSLIRKPAEKSGSSSSGSGFVPPVYSQGYPQTYTSPSSSSNTYSTPSQSSTTTQSKKQCFACHGTGRVVKNDATCWGSSTTKYCSECGQTVHCSHYHTICTICGGRGYR